MRYSLRRRARLTLGATLVFAALTPSAAHAATPRGVGQFPSTAGCTADETVAAKATIYNRLNGNRIGAVRLMYSRSCQTWWSRLVNDDGRAFTNLVLANGGGQGFSERVDSGFAFAGASYDTRMVPALVSAYPGGPVAATVGQGVGTLYRSTNEIAGNAETPRCLPPTLYNPCPTA